MKWAVTWPWVISRGDPRAKNALFLSMFDIQWENKGYLISQIMQNNNLSKSIFKVDIKLPILPQLVSLWCLYYNIWACTLLEDSEIGAPRSFMKKAFLKTLQNSQENICAGVSFAIKMHFIFSFFICNLFKVDHYSLWKITKKCIYTIKNSLNKQLI